MILWTEEQKMAMDLKEVEELADEMLVKMSVTRTFSLRASCDNLSHTPYMTPELSRLSDGRRYSDLAASGPGGSYQWPGLAWKTNAATTLARALLEPISVYDRSQCLLRLQNLCRCLVPSQEGPTVTGGE